jgi:hypothetical protein
MRTKAQQLVRIRQQIELAKRQPPDKRHMWFRVDEVEDMLEDLVRLKDLEK